MTLPTLTIPDDPAELPRWLEGRMLAADFGRFVAELRTYHSRTPGAPFPQDLSDRWWPVALAEGLDSVPADVLALLLKNPSALIAFQERILTEGGEYWDGAIDTSNAFRGAFERGKHSLERILATDAAPSNSRETPQAMPKVDSNVTPRPGRTRPMVRSAGRGYKIWAFVSTGLAACLVLALALSEFRGPAEPHVPKAQIAWGWAKPTGVAAEESKPREYLDKLAHNAEEWSLHRPGDAAGVGVRLAEFRMGCARLIHSAYGPLAPTDKTWLLERCREWAKLLDGHQQMLDAGADPLVVRAEVDTTVGLIAEALRAKAKQLG